MDVGVLVVCQTEVSAGCFVVEGEGPSSSGLRTAAGGRRH